MKSIIRYSLQLLPITIIVFMLTGCATGKWKKISYLTPSSKIIPGITPKVNLQLRSIKENTLSKEIETALKYGMQRNGGVAFADLSESDFVICLDLFFSYTKDLPEAVKYNTKIKVERVSNEYGGYDKIVRIGKETALGVLVANVSLYRIKDLSPITFFTITAYDTSEKPPEKSLKTKQQLADKLGKEIVFKIKDLMVADYRKIKTYIPNNANKNIQKAFDRNDALKLQYAIKKQIKTPTLNGLKTTLIKKKKYFANNNAKKESLLSNYYLYLLTKERTDISTENIKNLYRSYLFLLKETENEGLIIATANSLGRIEQKCKRLSINLD